MLRRMLMTTVAVVALAGAAVAQDQAKPGDAGQVVPQLAPAEQTPQAGSATTGQTGQQTGQSTAAQPPATAAQGQAVQEPAKQEAEKPATPPPGMKFIEVQNEAQFLANQEVIGKEVVNAGDEKLGTIADLVMDQDQKLVGVVLSVGGFLGIGDKWVGVPVDQIDFPTDGQPARLRVAVTEEQLKNAPDFVTKETVEANKAAEQAQQQMKQQQQQQIPPPATTTQ
jgi:sporulation protein YlmC with PRC-barrel domain